MAARISPLKNEETKKENDEIVEEKKKGNEEKPKVHNQKFP